MATRGVIDHPLAAFRPTTKARHVRFCTGFVEKDEFRQIECRLIGLPLSALFFHVGPILLARS